MPTIKDVANRAGVSPMTVSRVLNEAGNVRPSTRAKVMQAVEELGYVPSGVAKSLRSKRSYTLALIVSDSNNAFWMSVARGVEDAAQDRGYSVLLCNTDENVAKQKRYLDVVVSQQVDGVIIAPCDSSAENLAPLRRRKIPTVVVDRHIKGWSVDAVIGDSIAGARALVRHLIDLGHQRIATISGPATISTASDRVIGYRIALAEAGIPYDPRLVKEGEYRASSGERLTHQLLDEGLAPTAIFAANNALMTGAFAALEQRGLRVPQDMALVSFGDLPNTSSFFPFLTVADFASYEMGVNAAQLLLSRLESDVQRRPRYVVLPARLIIRHSCGSKLGEGDEGGLSLSLPISRGDEVQSLAASLNQEDIHRFSAYLTNVPPEVLLADQRLSSYDMSDVSRLLTVLQHQEADRLPHLDFQIASRAIYEYVLERELGGQRYDSGTGAPSLAPEDQIEFAQRLGMDAVICDLSRWSSDEYHAASSSVRTDTDLERLRSGPALAGMLGAVEQHLRASQGTGVGVVVSLPSFFQSAMRVVGDVDLNYSGRDRHLFEAAMDIFVDRGVRVLRAVCDRFADEIAFFIIDDDLSGMASHQAMPQQVYPKRMRRLLAPAKERRKLAALHTKAVEDALLPMVVDVGFDIIHPIHPDLNAALAVKRQWCGRLALIGGLPASILENASPEEIEDQVRQYCIHLAPGGGYVLGCSAAIGSSIPPENYLAMIEAVHRHGRYASLG